MDFTPEYDVHELIHQIQDGDVNKRLDALALVSDLGDMGDMGDMGMTAEMEDLTDTLIDFDACSESGHSGYRCDMEGTSLTSDQVRQLVEAVIQALEDNDVRIRKMAVLALGDLGAVTPDVVPALMRSLDDMSAEVRRRAAIALGELQATQATRALENALRDDDARVRKAAIQALDEFEF
jgi:HEAT repeat protein